MRKRSGDRARLRNSMMCLLALEIVLAAPAVAAAPPGASAVIGPPHFRGETLVRARMVLDRDTVSSGGSVGVSVVLTPEPGWHLYGPEHGDAGAPPTIVWVLPDRLRASGIAYPPSTRVTARGLTTYEYHGPTRLRVTLSAAAGATTAYAGVLRAQLTWFVCSKVCVRGGTTVRGAITVVPATGAHGPTG